MIDLLRCPVCGSQKIATRYKAGTNRRRDDSAIWNVSGCLDCTHGFLNPQPTWTELAPYYSQNYDPYIKNHGAEAVRDAETVRVAAASGVFRHLPIPRGKSVLDIGCGAGWFLKICRELGAQTFGIEPSVFGAKASRDEGLDVYEGMIGDYLREHGADRQFDVITANHVIEHTPDPIQMMRDMRRLLVPGGILWISVPNAASFYGKTLGGRWHSADLPYHLQQFSPKSFEMAASNANLSVGRVYTYSLPTASASSLRHVLRSRFKFPQRLSERIGFLNGPVSNAIAGRMDKLGMGEAIIGEFS